MHLFLLAIATTVREYYCRECPRRGTTLAILRCMLFQTNSTGRLEGDVTGTRHHLSESLLRRYVSNDLGPRPRKVLIEHLEQCRECRAAVGLLRETRRRLRDFERLAIMELSGAETRTLTMSARTHRSLAIYEPESE